MPGISEDEIERIKGQTNLAALVRSRGIDLKKHEGNDHLVGKCPFHEEDEASFIVTPAKGLFHCIGCGAAGNTIQFVEKFDGVSFRHAFELLNDGTVAFTSPPEGRAKLNTVRRLEPPVTAEAEDAELFRQVVDYYHERLLATPAALAYMASRGLRHNEAIERFRIGFADRTLGLRLPRKNRKGGAVIRARLQKIGLIRESGHEHFNGSVILPIFDTEGHVVEVYGRKIRNDLRTGTPKHLYLPGPPVGIWNEEGCFPKPGSKNQDPRTDHEVIICAAPLDALTFWVNNIRNVTFIYGTEGLPDYLFDALLTHRVKRVRLAYKANEDGNRAAARDAERLTAHGIECYRVKFPWGMDANEYALRQAAVALREGGETTATAKFLRITVDAAEWLGGSRAEGETLKAEDPPQANPEDVSRHDHACILNNKLAANLAAKEKSPSANSARETLSPTSSLIRQGEYQTLTLDRREYRVGGLEKNNGLDVLKVVVRLRHGEDFHLDGFDMTRDGERRRFVERAAEETGLEQDLLKRDLGKLLLALEEAQQERLTAAVETAGRTAPSMTPDEREEALALLKSPNLIERITGMFEDGGLVGEETNRLAAYLACTSRKLAHPLAVIIQSTSAAGKSTLMEAVLAMFPEEERVQYSAMTGQSLYYLGETDLKHRILAIVEEEGAEKASYALKLLQSEGELTIASTGKDPRTGRMETQEYHVEGPVMIFLTTTAVDIDEELQNRCLTLTVDESREQTARIHALQRQARTLEGLQRKKRRQKILALLRNAQRLLEPLEVVNPWADRLTFTAERTRTRRDHEKYLTLIDAIALLHQHQRGRSQISDDGGQQSMNATNNQEPSTKNQEHATYITVTLDDIALANRLAPELLGRAFDELPPQARRLLDCIKTLVQGICQRDAIEQHLALFSRRELCETTGWTYSQVKRHLIRLQELEHIIPRYGGMGSTMRYELLANAAESNAAAPPIGLMDVAKLRKPGSTTTTRTPAEATLTPPCQSQVTKLSPLESASNDNLANLSTRTSGTALLDVVP